MSVQITVTGIDQVSGELAALAAKLGDSGRADLHAGMGAEVQIDTADYIRKISTTRHRSARLLGAKPTGHLAAAAEAVSSAGALSSDSQAATLRVSTPGMTRAFRDVTITPGGGKQWLTIPMHRRAYGKRAGELGREIEGMGGRMFRPGKSRILAIAVDGKLVPLYALVKSVTQSQDRTLLPSDKVWRDASVRGARKVIASALRKGGNL